ncbi:MAG: hypothetical protein J6T10_24515 [Methanobrevibacter sp.]|nr:hypothetical protein [Methanobrevibacter sp.]
MTNADKYLRDGVSVEELAKAIYNYYYNDDRKLVESINHFFNAPVQPTLTEDEKVILRNIGKIYKYIFRVANNELYLCTIKGMRYYDEDDREIGHDFLCYSHLFQFIKERRRILY